VISTVSCKQRIQPTFDQYSLLSRTPYCRMRSRTLVYCDLRFVLSVALCKSVFGCGAMSHNLTVVTQVVPYPWRWHCISRHLRTMVHHLSISDPCVDRICYMKCLIRAAQFLVHGFTNHLANPIYFVSAARGLGFNHILSRLQGRLQRTRDERSVA
jgi:hypothetical protein